MTTWTVINNPEINPGAPVTTSLMYRLRDNQRAINEGDPTVPYGERLLIEGQRTDSLDTELLLSPDGAGGVVFRTAALRRPYFCQFSFLAQDYGLAIADDTVNWANGGIFFRTAGYTTSVGVAINGPVFIIAPFGDVIINHAISGGDSSFCDLEIIADNITINQNITCRSLKLKCRNLTIAGGLTINAGDGLGSQGGCVCVDASEEILVGSGTVISSLMQYWYGGTLGGGYDIDLRGATIRSRWTTQLFTGWTGQAVQGATWRSHLGFPSAGGLRYSLIDSQRASTVAVNNPVDAHQHTDQRSRGSFTPSSYLDLVCGNGGAGDFAGGNAGAGGGSGPLGGGDGGLPNGTTDKAFSPYAGRVPDSSWRFPAGPGGGGGNSERTGNLPGGVSLIRSFGTILMEGALVHANATNGITNAGGGGGGGGVKLSAFVAINFGTGGSVEAQGGNGSATTPGSGGGGGRVDLISPTITGTISSDVTGGTATAGAAGDAGTLNNIGGLTTQYMTDLLSAGILEK